MNCEICRKISLRTPCFHCIQYYCRQHISKHSDLCQQVLRAVHGLSEPQLESFEDLAFLAEQNYRFREIPELAGNLAEIQAFVAANFMNKEYVLDELACLQAKCASMQSAKKIPASTLKSDELAYYKHFEAIIRSSALVLTGNTFYKRLAQLNSFNFLMAKGDITGARRICEVIPFEEELPEIFRIFSLFQLLETVDNPSMINYKTCDHLICFHPRESVVFCYFFVTFQKYYDAFRREKCVTKDLFSRIHYAYCELYEIMSKIALDLAGAHVMLVFVALSWLFCMIVPEETEVRKVAYRALCYSKQIKEQIEQDFTLQTKELTRRRSVSLIYNEFLGGFQILTSLEDCFEELEIATKLGELESYLDYCDEDLNVLESTSGLRSSEINQEISDLLLECRETDFELRIAMGEQINNDDRSEEIVI